MNTLVADPPLPHHTARVTISDSRHAVHSVSCQLLSSCSWQICSSQASYSQIRYKAVKHHSLTAYMRTKIHIFVSLMVVVQQFIYTCGSKVHSRSGN